MTSPGSPLTHDPDPAHRPWQQRLFTVIFEADTPAGKLFDVALLVSILASIVVVMLETVAPIADRYGPWLEAAEWVFTALFATEYVLRLASVRVKRAYALSFFGVVDLLAILPSLVTPFLPEARALLVVRSLRLLRVFRVFKLGRLLDEAEFLRRAVWDSRDKIVVFLSAVLVVVVIMGAAMYAVEGGQEGTQFTSLPQSMYWAVVTMTTVGYGDIAPQTALGQFLAAAIMILGYAFIIVPAGIVSATFATAGRGTITTQVCPSCTREGHASDARHCKYCGARL